MDDPSGVPGIWFIGLVAILLVVFMLPTIIVACVFAITLMLRQAWTRASRGSAIALLLWVVGAALVIKDPADVWMWLFD